MGVLTDLVDSLFNAIVGVLTGKPVSVAAPDTPIIPKTKPTADPIQPVYVSTVEPSNGLNTWQQSQPTPPTADPANPTVPKGTLIVYPDGTQEVSDGTVRARSLPLGTKMYDEWGGEWAVTETGMWVPSNLHGSIAPAPAPQSRNTDPLNVNTPSQPPPATLYVGTAPLPTTEGTVYLQIYVRPNDAPTTMVANAEFFRGFSVEFQGDYAVTNDGGEAFVTGKGILPYREYFITVSKAGYRTKHEPISFNEHSYDAPNGAPVSGRAYTIIVRPERD